MILNNKYILSALALAATLTFGGCASSYQPAKNMAKLDANFADSKWDGKKIPGNQVCSLFGGKGATPKMNISNIPQGTNAIIMEINDEGYAPLSSNGGHGKVGFWVDKGNKSITLKSVPGDSYNNLPKGTFIEQASKAGGKYATSGYLPPCSGGKNHMYSAKIQAVYKAKNDDEVSKLLGETYIQFGRY